MYITREHIQFYQDNGYLFLPEFYSGAEVAAMEAELPVLYAEESPRRVLEQDGSAVRSVYGSHSTSAVFDRLARDPRILEPTMEILGGDVYIHQFKINVKAAFGGEMWEWHRDYDTWHHEDGMPGVQALNVVVFLDEVNEFNGPLLLIPGSHKDADVEDFIRDEAELLEAGAPAWMANLTTKIKHSLDKATVAKLASRHGIVAPKGPRGSVLFFDSNIAHGSSQNMSPFDRTIVIVSYNSVANALLPVERPRPDFLASRDFRPLVPLVDALPMAQR
ncbi:MAG TPA: phytanoyl-CoA dioxygenase family protein [Herpetosiphonaceae bacterium]